MTLITNSEVKMAGSAWEEFSTLELFAGDTPLPVTTSEVVDATLLAAGVPANSVMGRSATGTLVYATWDAVAANAVKPIGITVAAVLPGAASGAVPCYRAGNFNPAALNWHSTFDTDAKKRLAFEGTGVDVVITKSPIA